MLMNLEKKLIRMKVVYYGVSSSGKTTNLEKLSQMEGLTLTKIDTKGEKTLVFDFSTKKVNLGDLTLTFALYTIPGQDIYKDIRLTVLKGVDGIVFVVDSQRERLQENIEFYKQLKADLIRVGKNPEDMPVVLQYNKKDLPNSMRYEELERIINIDRHPSFSASAVNEEGVLETFRAIESQLVSKVKRMMT